MWIKEGVKSITISAYNDEWEWSESEVAQSCPTLCDPMDCSLSGSSVHGIFQARVLEWIAMSNFQLIKDLLYFAILGYLDFPPRTCIILVIQKS